MTFKGSNIGCQLLLLSHNKQDLWIQVTIGIGTTEPVECKVFRDEQDFKGRQEEWTTKPQTIWAIDLGWPGLFWQEYQTSEIALGVTKKKKERKKGTTLSPLLPFKGSLVATKQTNTFISRLVCLPDHLYTTACPENTHCGRRVLLKGLP